MSFLKHSKTFKSTDYQNGSNYCPYKKYLKTTWPQSNDNIWFWQWQDNVLSVVFFGKNYF